MEQLPPRQVCHVLLKHPRFKVVTAQDEDSLDIFSYNVQPDPKLFFYCQTSYQEIMWTSVSTSSRFFGARTVLGEMPFMQQLRRDGVPSRRKTKLLEGGSLFWGFSRRFRKFCCFRFARFTVDFRSIFASSRCTIFFAQVGRLFFGFWMFLAAQFHLQFFPPGWSSQCVQTADGGVGVCGQGLTTNQYEYNIYII